MARTRTRAPPGGTSPSPQPEPGQSAKDRSKAQSRPVSGKAHPESRVRPPGPGPSRAQAAVAAATSPARVDGRRPHPPRRFSGTVMAWGAVGLVIVIVVVLVVVKVHRQLVHPDGVHAGDAGPGLGGQRRHQHPGCRSTTRWGSISRRPPSPCRPPSLKGQPPLTLDGKTPAMLYYGAEYCPYCAAERWAMTAALSRFGTWSDLKITASSHTDIDAETHTFSFYGATFTSPYITSPRSSSTATSPSPAGATPPSRTRPRRRRPILTKYRARIHPRATAGRSGSPSSTSTTWPSSPGPATTRGSWPA